MPKRTSLDIFVDLGQVRRRLWGRKSNLPGPEVLLIKVTTWGVVKPGQTGLPHEVEQAIQRGEFVRLEPGMDVGVLQCVPLAVPTPRATERKRNLREAGFDPDDF